MSLDVYLLGKSEEIPCRCADCNNEHTRKESEVLYQANITHNMCAMAENAGIYKALWRPEEIGITKALQLVKPLQDGIKLMKSDPDYFKKFNPSNGWGSYDIFISFIKQYHEACKQYPDADVSVSK